MRFVLHLLFIAILLVTSFGCAWVRPSKISIRSDTELPGSMLSDLRNLSSAQDVLTDESEIDELVRLSALADEQNMTSYLRANGYYDASVHHRFGSSKTKSHVFFDISPGPKYHIDIKNLHWPDDYRGPRPAPTNELDHASSAAILSSRSAVIRRLRELGYPNARMTNQVIVVDHADRTVNSRFDIDPGPLMVFGDLEVLGLRKLNESYVRKARTWRENDTYDIRKIELMERRLGASGLFSSIVTRRAPPTEDATDVYDVSITLRERKARSIQLGVGYRTDTGAETTAQLQHRNALGSGENILLRGRYTEEGFDAELRLLVPFFRRSDQQWGVSLTYADESPDAYDSRALKSETWISRELNRHWLARIGVGLQYLDERQNDVSDSYFLATLPTRIVWDRTDDRLDATKGGRVIFATAPFQGINDSDLFFWKNLVTLNGFVPLKRDRSLCLAIRLTGGAIEGTSLGFIPAEERFYAGGGQSVRGYAYQSLSPRNGDSILGGLSLAESSIEFRAKLGNALGAVIFIDGGGAFDETIPDFKDSFRWGTGAGIRYFTPVGPLRLDVGMPLDKRDGIDKSWQFYVSIGQAF